MKDTRQLEPKVSFVHVSGTKQMCLRINAVVLRKMELVVPKFTHIESEEVDGNLRLKPIKLLGYKPYQRTKLLRLSKELLEAIEISDTLLKMPVVYRSSAFIVKL